MSLKPYSFYKIYGTAYALTVPGKKEGNLDLVIHDGLSESRIFNVKNIESIYKNYQQIDPSIWYNGQNLTDMVLELDVDHLRYILNDFEEAKLYFKLIENDWEEEDLKEIDFQNQTLNYLNFEILYDFFKVTDSTEITNNHIKSLKKLRTYLPDILDFKIEQNDQKSIWIVQGETGEKTDYITWIIGYFENQEEAEEYCQKANENAQAIIAHYGKNNIPFGSNPLDPEMTYYDDFVEYNIIKASSLKIKKK